MSAARSPRPAVARMPLGFVWTGEHRVDVAFVADDRGARAELTVRRQNGAAGLVDVARLHLAGLTAHELAQLLEDAGARLHAPKGSKR